MNNYKNDININKKKQNIGKKRAVALRYKKEENAPKLIAKGSGKDSDTIVRTAKDNDIPIITDPDLTYNLYRLNINEEIPVELFEIIASIYSFVMRKKEVKNEKEN
ncbi:MAG TPA: EscU/YscU/HrcU family type III secretion system export apparatus switch protein [Exilispira sp.]|nr:EscU/YscU/HrcU family type III secretion system export apparatus switch protein [Exilispira sp.]